MRMKVYIYQKYTDWTGIMHRRRNGGGGGLEPPKIAKLPINEAQIALLFEHLFTSTLPSLPVSSSYDTV